MATTKSTTSRGTTAKPRASRPANKSLPARTGRTIKERPYTSAAIATGAITAVAAAAAGAFFFSRRDKSLRETGEDLSNFVKDGFADASGKLKELLASDGASNSGKTQQEIAEEALTLKETGAAASPVDALAADQIKAGAVAY